MQGAEGVKNVLDILRSQLDDVLAISGKKRCSSVYINTGVSCSRREYYKKYRIVKGKRMIIEEKESDYD